LSCDRADAPGTAHQAGRTVTRPGVMCQGSSVCHDPGMADVAPGPESTPSQRWLARLSFVLAGAAIVILVVVAGLKSLAMLAVGLAAALVSLAAAYVFLSRARDAMFAAPGTAWARRRRRRQKARPAQHHQPPARPDPLQAVGPSRHHPAQTAEGRRLRPARPALAAHPHTVLEDRQASPHMYAPMVDG
jgi:hypothetical protein